jgi:hypothetical protein
MQAHKKPSLKHSCPISTTAASHREISTAHASSQKTKPETFLVDLVPTGTALYIENITAK